MGDHNKAQTQSEATRGRAILSMWPTIRLSWRESALSQTRFTRQRGGPLAQNGEVMVVKVLLSRLNARMPHEFLNDHGRGPGLQPPEGKRMP